MNRQNATNPTTGKHFLLYASCMQSSGSGWFIRMVNDVMVAAGHDNMKEIAAQYPMRCRLIRPNFDGFIARPFAYKLLLLEQIRAKGHTFIIKSHRGPWPAIVRMMNAGKIIPLYQYRDPRDVIVSAFSRGQKARARGARRSIARLGQYESFARIVTFEQALRWMRGRLIPVWEQWQRIGNVTCFRYEDLLEESIRELRRIAALIGFDASEEELRKIDAHYRRDDVRQNDPNLHYRKGGSGQFREALTDAQLQRCHDVLGAYIEAMGYEV